MINRVEVFCYPIAVWNPPPHWIALFDMPEHIAEKQPLIAFLSPVTKDRHIAVTFYLTSSPTVPIFQRDRLRFVHRIVCPGDRSS